MADEIDDLNFDLDDNAEVETQQRKENKRLKDLSEKVRLTAEERDEKEKLLQEQKAQLEAEKQEKEFYKNFNTLASKYPGAAEYQEQILEKTKTGYDPEDAAVAILNKEGKLPGMTQAPITPPENPAGGSAATALPAGEKSASEMTQEERRAELAKLSGDEMQQAFRSASSL